MGKQLPCQTAAPDISENKTGCRHRWGRSTPADMAGQVAVESDGCDEPLESSGASPRDSLVFAAARLC
jgi:hypothetical protein